MTIYQRVAREDMSTMNEINSRQLRILYIIIVPFAFSVLLMVGSILFVDIAKYAIIIVFLHSLAWGGGGGVALPIVLRRVWRLDRDHIKNILRAASLEWTRSAESHGWFSSFRHSLNLFSQRLAMPPDSSQTWAVWALFLAYLLPNLYFILGLFSFAIVLISVFIA